MRIRLRDMASQHADPLRGRTASRAWRTDGVGRFELADFLGEIAHEAAALDREVGSFGQWNA